MVSNVQIPYLAEHTNVTVKMFFNMHSPYLPPSWCAHTHNTHHHCHILIVTLRLFSAMIQTFSFLCAIMEKWYSRLEQLAKPRKFSLINQVH